MADIQSSETEISAPFLIWGLAEEFLSLNRPEECINLLLLLLEKISLAKTPMIEVKTRLRLGDILIRYTTEWKKAEIILMKANLILDEMNFDEIQEIPDYYEIKLRVLNVLISLYQYSSLWNEAKKTIGNAISFISTSLEGKKSNDPEITQMLYRYGDAFRFSLVKVNYQLGKIDDAIEILDYFDENSSKQLWIIAQISKLHLLICKDSQKIDKILAFSNNLWINIKNMLPEEIQAGNILNNANKFWTENYNLLQQICRYWGILSLFLLGSGKFTNPSVNNDSEVMSDTSLEIDSTTVEQTENAEKAITEFKKYFIAFKVIKRMSNVSDIDTFLTIEELIIFESLLDQILMRTTKLKLQTDLKRSFKSSKLFIDKVLHNYSYKKYTNNLDPITQSNIERLLSLKVLTLYNQSIYFLYEGHINLCGENIITLIEILEQYPKLFANYHYQLHILIGLFFIQTRNTQAACEHFEIVEKSCSIIDPQTSAWATVFFMIALLNETDLKDITEKTRQHLFLRIDNTERQEVFRNSNLQTIILFIKGCLYFSTGAIQDAIEHLRKANINVREIENDEARSQIDLQLSIAFSSNSNDIQSSRFIKHALNLAVRGRAYYLLSFAHQIQSAYNINVSLWKEEKFQEIDKYLEKERESCKAFEDKLKNWLPQSNDKYFLLREMSLGTIPLQTNI